jgi:hypothetical protein
MKAFTQIEFMITDLQVRLKTYKAEHAKLDQIDMLSSTGNKLTEEINQTYGKIEALYWVINNQIERL